MSLIDFTDEETKQQQDNLELNNFINKDTIYNEKLKKYMDEGMSVEQARARAESEVYLPETLEKIEFQEANIEFGKRVGISFYVTEEEYEKIKSKWKVLQQCDENRIASSVINEFVKRLVS